MVETILIGEDDPLQLKLLGLMLTKTLGYKIISASNGREVLTHIKASNIGDINAVLLDIEMPELDGLEALKYIRKYRPDLPVLMVTAQNNTNLAVKAIKAGASDFIIKPPDPALLHVAIKNAIRMSVLSRELTKLKRDKEGALSFDDLIGHSEGLAKAILYGRKAAASDVPVLITGETSTGKELLARAIHGESRRVGSPLIAINCSAIPEHEIEGVLFGHEKTAGTNSNIRSEGGKFREAERGTIFLDDIHLLTPAAQIKLLRVLQEREIEPVGSSKPVKVNIRVISATNRNLKDEVNSGRFREDLYFRLNVLTIDMPALRERQNDILPLVEYFINKISAVDALPIKSLTADAKQYLLDYSWPGNVRELEGLIHRALVLSEGEVIDRALLVKIHNSYASESSQNLFAGSQINIRLPNGLFKTMDQIEMEVMQATLDHYDHNITRASEALGIAKSTFYRKIKPVD